MLLFALILLSSCKQEPAPATNFINIAVPYEMDSLDPHVKARVGNYSIASNFYEPLASADADMKIQPCLARSWENPDLFTWVFHLEPSAQFHSGRPMRAEDVVYSFERLLQSQELEIAALLTDVSGIQAVDPLTVKISTKHPSGIFLNKISFVMIIPKGATSDQLVEKVDGTGPYKLQGWKKGDSIHLIRNDQYWGKKAPLREVTFFLNRNPENAIQELLSGRCQLVQCNAKKLKSILQTHENYEMLLHDSLFVKYLAYDVSRDETPYCNVRPNPFRNKDVRQAIQMAIDRQTLIGELSMYAIAATQPIPPFVFGYNPAIKAPAYNLAAARALLAKAGLPNGFQTTLHTRKILEEPALSVQRQLRQIGIQVEVKVLPDREFFQTMDKRDASFFLNRVATTTGDASDILEGALHSMDPSGHYGSINYEGYQNPQIDHAIEESAGILKVEDRRTALQQIMSMVMEDLPWVPLYIDQDVYAINKSFAWRPRNDSQIHAQEIELRP